MNKLLHRLKGHTWELQNDGFHVKCTDCGIIELCCPDQENHKDQFIKCRSITARKRSIEKPEILFAHEWCELCTKAGVNPLCIKHAPPQ